MSAAPAGGQPADILADLHNRQIASIGAEVVEMVGRARSVINSPSTALADLSDAGLGFLVQLLAPLQSCLEQVEGDVESLRAKADEWRSIAADLDDTVRRLDVTARAEWTGPAADAFDVTAKRFASTAGDAALACSGVSTLLGTSADLMAGARGLIVDILDRVVEFMIVAEAAASASARFTAGASEAAALTAILGEVAEGVEQAVKIVERSAGLLERIGEALRNVSGVFGQITVLLGRLRDLRGGMAPRRENPDDSVGTP